MTVHERTGHDEVTNIGRQVETWARCKCGLRSFGQRLPSFQRRHKFVAARWHGPNFHLGCGPHQEHVLTTCGEIHWPRHAIADIHLPDSECWKRRANHAEGWVNAEF